MPNVGSVGLVIVCGTSLSSCNIARKLDMSSSGSEDSVLVTKQAQADFEFYDGCINNVVMSPAYVVQRTDAGGALDTHHFESCDVIRQAPGH